MKLTKTKAILGLIFFMSTLAIGTFGVMMPQKAEAAAPTFVSGTNTALPAPSESNFTFISPTRVLYKNPSDGTTTTYNLQLTKACDGSADSMFLCNDVGDTYATNEGRGYSYWYWPDDAGTVPNVAAGQYPCASGLVSSIKVDTGRNDGQEVRGATLSVVTPVKLTDKSGSPACSVTANSNATGLGGGDLTAAIRESDLEGSGAAVVSSDNVYSTMHVDSANGHYCSGTSGDTQDDSGYSDCYIDKKYVVAQDLIGHKNSGQDRTTLLGLGTIFHWTSTTELSSYFNGSIDDKLVQNSGLGASIITSIKAGFKNTTGTVSQYGSGYDYYTNQSGGGGGDCYNSNDQYWSAIIAVKQSDPSQAIVLARHGKNAAWFSDWGGSDNQGNGKGNGSGSSPFWDSIKCLVESSGDHHYRAFPGEVWMDPDHQSYTNKLLGLGDSDVQKGATTPPSTIGSSGGGCAAGTDPSSGDCQAGNDAALDCGEGNWNWLICPFINIVQGAAEQLDHFITGELDIDATATFNNDGYYRAWSSFRVIATAILIIAGLIMIGGEAFGMQILDAYTIRKVLPRLLIAVIGISLSWPLLKFVVNLIDTIGIDIRGIIYGPFTGVHAHLSAGLGVASSLGTILGTAGLVYVFGPAALTFILTGLLALFMAFLILVVRQVAIITLIIMSPLAIAMYILPNTQKVWKLWSDNFLGLMLVFPVISALIAAGHVFAVVSISNGTGISSIIGLVAYFVPYFLVPFAFKLVTGAIGNLAGVINDRGRGAFDRLKKTRQNAASKNFKAMQENRRFDGGPDGKLNKIGGWASDPMSNAALASKGRVPGLRKRALSLESHLEEKQAEQTRKVFEQNNAAGFNDKAHRLLSGSHGAGLDENGNIIDDKTFSVATKKKLMDANLFGRELSTIEDFTKAAEILSGSDDSNERDAGTTIHASRGRLATLYQDPETAKASRRGAGLIGLAAHGFADGEDLARVGNALDKSHGEGFSKSVLATAQLAGSKSRPDIKNGYGVVKTKSVNGKPGEWVSGISAEGGRAHSLVKTLDSDSFSQAKGGAWKALEPAMKEMMDPTSDKYDAGESQALEEQIFGWGGKYSRASVDVKGQVLAYINERSQTDKGFEKRWNDSQQVGYNQGATGQGQPGGPPPAAGPPQPPGNSPPAGPPGS